MDTIQQTTQQTTNKRLTNDQQQLKNDKNVKKKRSNVFIPPTIDEVKEYFNENGYSEQSATKAFNYYDIANWYDSKGSAIKNWKQKMQMVWFKDENKESKRTKLIT